MTFRTTANAPGERNQFQTRRRLSRLLGSLAAVGTLVTAVGGAEASGTSNNKKRKKRGRPGSQGPAGPPGPTGPTGPEGPPGTLVTLVSVTGPRSDVLAATAGREVESVAECGEQSTPINCGWVYVGNTTDFDRTVTQVLPGSFRGVGMCTVRLRRTATVSTAGGQVIAIATCTR
jgi:hypothetical protein